MRMQVVASLLIAAGGVLAGCGGTEAPAAEEHRELLDATRAPLERAQAVEELNAARKAQLDAQSDEASGSE